MALGYGGGCRASTPKTVLPSAPRYNNNNRGPRPIVVVLTASVSYCFSSITLMLAVIICRIHCYSKTIWTTHSSECKRQLWDLVAFGKKSESTEILGNLDHLSAWVLMDLLCLPDNKVVVWGCSHILVALPSFGDDRPGSIFRSEGWK